MVLSFHRFFEVEFLRSYVEHLGQASDDVTCGIYLSYDVTGVRIVLLSVSYQQPKFYLRFIRVSSEVRVRRLARLVATTIIKNELNESVTFCIS